MDASMSFMSELGARLVDNGYPVLPLIPNTKVPGAYLSGQWRPYSDWTKHCTRGTKAFELDLWSRWPGAGIGVAGGVVVGVDIDIVQDAALCSEVAGMARHMLGDTPALRIGMAPKRLLVYRAETVFAGFKRHPIEILARGQQFVAEAIHPETGQPYYWPGESLADLDISQLPVVTEAQCRAFAEAAYNRLPPSLRPATLGADDGSPHQTSHYLTGTYDAIEDALRYIPNNDLPYDEWVSMGMAIKGALGDAGEALYARWSASSVKDVPDTTARSWRSYRPTSIGAGSVYYNAEKYGWHCPAHLTMNGAVAFEAGNHPAQALLDAAASIKPAPEVQANVFVPEAFRQLDGVIGDFVAYALSSAIRPQPILAMASAIAAVGVLAGRRYRSPTNLRTNVYVVGMAESGGGKDHPRKCIVEAFAKAGLTRLIGGNKIASGSGLLSAINRQPSTLFQLDEFGQFLMMAVDKRRAAKHIAEIWDHLTELSTSAASVFLGAEYADQRDRPRQDIIQPCCVVHATTVPAPFWQALQSGSLSDGSFARWLLFQTDDPIPDRVKRPIDITNVPDRLVAGLKAIVSGASGWKHGNLADAGPNSDPTPYIVPYDGAAEKALDQLADAITDRQRASLGTVKSALLARVWEHVVKLALIHAVSLDPADPVIDLKAVERAEQIVTYCTETMMRDADRFVADNETQSNHKRVLDMIRRAGSDGLVHSKLVRGAQFLKSRDLRDILHSLVEGEVIAIEQVKTATKPSMIYRVAE
jgi:hypothetical protein